MQIDHHRQIEPALCRPDIGNITRPFLVWLVGMEVPIQPVGYNVEAMMAIGCCFVFLGSDHIDTIIPHQSPHAPMPNAQAGLFQLLRHPRAAITAQAEMVLFSDMGQQHHVVTLTLTDRTATPSPEAT